jgi:hypothetical protein
MMPRLDGRRRAEVYYNVQHPALAPDGFPPRRSQLERFLAGDQSCSLRDYAEVVRTNGLPATANMISHVADDLDALRAELLAERAKLVADACCEEER